MKASTRTPTNDLELIQCCASRIISLTTEIERAWEIGIPHGEHMQPWALDFQQSTIRIYLEAVPVPYALRVARTFSRCVDMMGTIQTMPTETEEWRIVASYLEAVAISIRGHLRESSEKAGSKEEDLRPSVPSLVPVGGLAPLLHPDGVKQLRLAGEVIVNQCSAQRPSRPSDTDIELIRLIASGHKIMDIATSCGYSRSTLQRKLRRLWKRLGVSDSREAILVGAHDGWLRQEQ